MSHNHKIKVDGDLGSPRLVSLMVDLEVDGPFDPVGARWSGLQNTLDTRHVRHTIAAAHNQPLGSIGQGLNKVGQ